MDMHFFLVERRHAPAADDTAAQSAQKSTYCAFLASGEAFAQQMAPSPQAIGPFCYPLGSKEASLPPEQSAKLKYTFTLTNSDGRPLHGFCRRLGAPAAEGSETAQVRLDLSVASSHSWRFACVACMYKCRARGQEAALHCVACSGSEACRLHHI